jgi:D-glycero-alpha-D-manno-heptose-7-phosphate kinase
VSRTVTIAVPVRVCDVGGWTDTWFAERGRVCSVAVEPGVTVSVRASSGNGDVTIDLDDGVTFTVGNEPPEHRLLAAAVAEAGDLGPLDVRIGVTAAVPRGSSLGTSASVCVALIAALDAARGEIREPSALATAAHRAEADRLGRQSGVQDQLAAAHGGVNLIEMDAYPHARVSVLGVPPDLGGRLAHVAYGGGHDSSAVHEEVIAALAGEGAASPRLGRLRWLALEAEHALRTSDLDAYGAVLTSATEAQAALHPALVSTAAHELIDVARAVGASGWKVNGAGGAGGSISILCREVADVARIADRARDLGHTPLALHLARRGARVVTA